MKPIAIIKTGSSFPEMVRIFQDFEHWIIRYSKAEDNTFNVIHAAEGETLPRVERLSGVIITGSHAMVTDEDPWSTAISRWIPGLIDNQIPLLGICYGHQLMARAMRGKAGYHPGGIEIGTTAITLTSEGENDPLIGMLPRIFKAHVIHSQTVTEPQPGAVILARNSFESCHAMRVGSAAWGVQFHPEFSEDIMKSYIKALPGEVADSGQDSEALLASVTKTKESNRLIASFIDFCRDRDKSTKMKQTNHP